MKHLTLALLSLCTVITAYAKGWHCENKNFEANCSGGKCQVSTSFTPMSISVSDKGNFSACAYSGCWEGKVSVQQSAGFLIYTAKNLPFSSADNSSNVLLAIDISDNIGTIKVSSFVMPVQCR